MRLLHRSTSDLSWKPAGRCWPAVLALLALMMLATACGGKHGAAAALQPLPPSALADPGATGGFAGLPGLSALPQPNRAGATVGPGWYSLTPSHLVASANTSTPAGHLLQFSTPQLGYAVFGMTAFTPGAGPTSAKVDVSGVTGNYFLGFSDFKSGHWVFAGPFNNDATVEIPSPDGFRTPGDYVNAYTSSYVALAVPTGSALTLESLQVGIAPAAHALRPPTAAVAAGGDAGAKVIWQPSPDADAPDFVGYFLERAPLLSGDFVRLTAQPLHDLIYLDATAPAGTQYRWRIAAVDAAGEPGLWLGFNGGGIAGQATGPIVKVAFPTGKIYGPLTQQFDLSGSYSPDGDPITEYAVGSLGTLVTSPTPLVSLALKPGSYPLIARVKTATDTTQIFLNITIYPKWDSAPQVVSEPLVNTAGASPRLLFARSGRIATGKLLTCGMDLYDGSIVFRQQQADGSFGYVTFPFYDGVYGLTELVHGAGDIFYLGYMGQYSYTYIAWDPSGNGGRGAGVQQTIYQSPYAGIPIVHLALAASPSGSVWAVYTINESATNKLMCQELTLPAASADEVDSGFPSLDCLDAACHSADNTVDIAYTLPAGLLFKRWDTPTATALISSAVDPAPPASVDVEEDPVSGEPGFLYFENGPLKFNFRQRDSGGGLSGPYVVDPLVSETDAGKLLYTASKTYAAINGGAATYAVYELGGASATLRNSESSLASNFGLLDLAPYSGEQLLGLCYTAVGQVELRRIDPDGTDQLFHSFDATESQGLNLAAARGSDGVHAVFMSLSASATRHLLLQGGVWAPQASIPSSFEPSVAATNAGEVYISYCNSGVHRLRRWDAGTSSLIDVGQDEAGLSINPTLLGGNPQSDSVYWLHWDDAAAKFQVTHGNSGGFTNYTETVNLTPLWDGAVLAPDSSSTWSMLFTGGGLPGTPDSGYIAWEEGANDTWLFPPPTRTPLQMLTNDYVRGRCFAAVPVRGPSFLFAASVFYIAMGQNHQPVRYTRDLTPVDELTDIPLTADFANYLNQDMRRTVSADCTPDSLTSVALIMSLDGQDKYMEWSVNGDFRRLALPPGLEAAKQVCRGTIVIGGDGLWHILYAERESDRIMSWNAVVP